VLHVQQEEDLAATATEVPAQRDPDVGVLQAVFEFFEQPGPVDEPPVDENPDEVATAPHLGPRERAVLDFESRRFKNPGRKEQAIREEFDVSPTQYFQIVNALLDDPDALAYNPTLVARLRRVREARQRARH
jgi:hypothetical protein